MHGLAYAKINLTLEVAGKRPDGYHELVSLMQTVSLADGLSLEPAEDLSLDCDVPELAGDDNLVLEAARLLGRGGRFVLRKRIPVAGGLGGGSSDAALALRLLDGVYGLGLSGRQLGDAAARLGSDVPFFLHAGTALVKGRGERVTPLPDLPERWLVLLNPRTPLSTARVFGELRPEEYASVARQDLLANDHPHPSPLPPAGEGTEVLPLLSPAGEGTGVLPPLVNTLEAPALRLEPAIGDCRQRLAAAGASQVLLSGSGPTVFGLAADEADARRMARETGGMAVRFVPRHTGLALDEQQAQHDHWHR